MDNLNCFEKLQSLNMTVSDGGSEATADYIKRYNDGKASKNLCEQYELILAMERGGANTYNVELSRILEDALNEDETRAIEAIDNGKDALTTVLICYELSDGVIERMILEPSITNPLVKFEVIRQAIGRRRSSALSDPAILASGFVQLSSLGDSVFSFAIRHFQFRYEFFPAIGLALGDLSEDAIKLFAENITIGRGSLDFVEAVNSLLNSIKADKFDHVINAIAETIYSKWCNLLENTQIEKGVDEVIVCSYSNLILCSMLKLFANVDDFNYELNCVLSEMENCLYAWYADSSSMLSKYFVCATKIYMLNLVSQNHIFNIYMNKPLFDKLHRVCTLIGNHHDFWKYSRNGITIDNVIIWDNIAETNP